MNRREGESRHGFDKNEIEGIAKNINTSARNSFNLLEDILMWARTQSQEQVWDYCFEKSLWKNMVVKSGLKVKQGKAAILNLHYHNT